MRRITSLVLLTLAACSARGAEQETAGAAPPPPRTDVVQAKASPHAPTGADRAAPLGTHAPAHTPAPAANHAKSAAEPPRSEQLRSYPWHDDPAIEALPATDTLQQRFAPPAGFARVALPEHSFGAWLRDLPLAAEGTPVRSYLGRVLLPGDHRNIAAVATLDVGSADLQQCADVVMRLHAEWLWHRGRTDEASYPSGAGPIPWTRYRGGGYPAPVGNSFVWKRRGPRANDHRTYRKFLDVVFSWSNTVALAHKSLPASRDEVAPGQFFVLPGSPGHTVQILDIATHPDGRRVALLGQSFMPAQSFQVLRPNRREVWFPLDDDGANTPFWRAFPWSSLHRFPD